MIQVLEGRERKPSLGQRLSQGVGRGLEMGSQLMQQNAQKQAISNVLGPEFSDLPEDFQKIALQQGLRQKNESEKLQGDLELEKEQYKTISDAFGKKFADVWKASPVGGKTELLSKALEASSRGHNVNELLSNFSDSDEFAEKNVEIPQVKMKDGSIPKTFKWPDFSKRPKGYSPKEWNDERKQWRKENAPIFDKNRTQVKSIKRDELGISKLSKLNNSKKLPEGFERYLINPETGDFYGLAQISEMVSPEAQEWAKEIARFQNRAKDAFGSRVTNFDLQSYMKQFPGLMNTKEGRKRILKMMTINNKLDGLYENTLQKVYQKYGLAGIPQEKADEIARGLIGKETEKLENDFTKLDEENIESEPEHLSGRIVDVVGPDGQIYEVDESEIQQLPEGYRII